MASGEKSEPPARARSNQFRIGFLVHDVSRLRRTLFDQAMRPLGITRAQWWALANLSRHEGVGVVQTDLARVMDMGKVTVGGLIDRLEASGHVERHADLDDRRVKRIFITPRGYQVLEDMRAVGRDLNMVILADISPEAIREAEGVLHKMKENLRETLGAAHAAKTEDI
jgi:MarR family transcriptional regulator, transcriptional regulator for hemolysin